MVLVVTARLPARVQRLTAALPEDDRSEAAIDQRIALLGDLARQALPTPWLAGSAAEEVRARVVRRRILGSRWAVSTGCGVDIEGEDGEQMVACGMGSVPPRSQRFLHFFSKAQRG
jgi:hypothetical protein